MKYGLFAAVCAALVTAASLAGILDAPRSASAIAAPGDEAFEIFSLKASGSAAVCSVRKPLESGPVSTIALDGGCDDLLPGLSGVRSWKEMDDGSVVFSTDAGDAVISFAVADGVAYESFRPRSPLISLVAEN